MDTFLEELIREENKKAEWKRSCDIAGQLIAIGNISLEEIAKITSLTLEEVTMLAREQST